MRRNIVCGAQIENSVIGSMRMPIKIALLATKGMRKRRGPIISAAWETPRRTL